mmetsp:Transcript_5219/g.10839  ORF Transcript_5219/g.10839 Transcript_5219/m.10839 type:complete len:242 (+) Transcript_5219:273-998(+)
MDRISSGFLPSRPGTHRAARCNRDHRRFSEKETTREKAKPNQTDNKRDSRRQRNTARASDTHESGCRASPRAGTAATERNGTTRVVPSWRQRAETQPEEKKTVCGSAFVSYPQKIERPIPRKTRITARAGNETKQIKTHTRTHRTIAFYIPLALRLPTNTSSGTAANHYLRLRPTGRIGAADPSGTLWSPGFERRPRGSLQSRRWSGGATKRRFERDFGGRGVPCATRSLQRENKINSGIL